MCNMSAKLDVNFHCIVTQTKKAKRHKTPNVTKSCSGVCARFKIKKERTEEVFLDTH